MAIGDLSFAFDPSKESPESVRKKREIVAAILATNQAPANLGQGLNALGEGITANVLRSRAEKGQAYGNKQAADTMAGLFGGNTPAPASSPSMGPSDGPASTDWLAYSNQGATRNQPISEELQNALSFLPELGVTMEVFSGGQPGIDEGGPRVGSTRHDHGGAADVFFMKDGQRLDWANPEHLPIFEEIVRRGKAQGLTGFGAGDGYMQPGSMHIGFGDDAVWGAGGKGENAPDWLRNAFYGSGAEPQGAVQEVTAALAGQPQRTQVAQGPSLNQLYQAAQNPWLNEGQQGVINALIQQQTQANDPLRQLQLQQGQLGLEKSRLELDQMRNPQQQMTAEQQNLAWRAQQAGLQPGTPEYQEFILGGGKGPMVSVNVGEGDKFFEELDKKNAQMFSDLSNAGAGAQRKLMQIDRLAGLLENSPTGGGAAFKQMLGNFGINTEGLSEIQAAQALINELVPQQRPAGSGPMSDADLELFKQSLPRIINQPGGNDTILQTMRGIAEYEAQQGQIADMVSNRAITPAEGRKRLRELSNPLEGFGERTKGFKAPEPQQEPQGAPQPGQVVDGWRFKGGDPSDQNNWEQI